MSKRIGVFGWGVVAPKSPNIEAFKNNLKCAISWLTPFNGFGPDNFLVGVPEFQFEDYREFIDKRFAPRQFQKIKEKMDQPTLYAIGCFIQALSQNPGIEEELKALGLGTRVYVGTGLGALGTLYDASVAHYESQNRWNRFWSSPARNSALRDFLELTPDRQKEHVDVPAKPDGACSEDYIEVERAWNAFWVNRSPELREYLAELAAIDSMEIEGPIDAGKMKVMREKEKGQTRLQEKWRAPDPPWKVTANVIWNIHNSPAAQISILGKINGLAFAPVAACSTFGVTLQLAMKAIQSGEIKAAVIGATDPAPHPLTVGSFFSARVTSADGRVSAPLTRLQGTHVAGGAVIWIVGDLEHFQAKGFKPLGMEPVAVGVSSDAHHIITPSLEGPTAAMKEALTDAGATPNEFGTWDLHATATPGDYAEMGTFRKLFADSVLVTARKGTFGHGMSAGGGWELTAQYLGYAEGELFPTPMAPEQLNASIAELHRSFVYNTPCALPSGFAGKLSMGIGGVNACVVSRPIS